MKIGDLKPGDFVRYIPSGEKGTVREVRTTYAFVHFGPEGPEGQLAACRFDTLEKLQ